MPPIQLPLTLAQRHRNQHLFSDHFLNVTLPANPEWAMLAPDAGAALATIAPLVRAFIQAPSQVEAQTEDELIKPVLRVLGHTFEVQAALKTPDGTKKPDYVFYRDAAAMAANKNTTLDETALQGKAFAVGDAKAWDRPLDRTLKAASGDQFTNKNPAYQIAFYIQHSGVDWGILTNGRLWRLYHKDSAHKQDRYYEINLPDLVEAGDAEAFLYFFALFRRAAFEPGPLSLAALVQESAAYARSVGDSLKLQVYEALREVAQGLLDYPGNALATDPAMLKQIYDSSLIVLYRLLFILYAEARELLPLRESAAYRDEYSLEAIKREIVRRKAGGTALLPTTARLWAKLKDLFQIIDQGSPPLKVATFNGGLFDGQKHPFLERHTVGDARLLEAIDKLARVGGEFVDYRDLAERHLGTIYEGLLEYHLQPIAPADGWTIDLFNQNGERHRTGSYYTPDFVVQYIVEQTLRPVLDAAVAGPATDDAKIAAVLAVNVLDPAMGSGHFPVAAMEYIARYLTDLGVTPAADAQGEADLAYWKRRVAQSCIYGVDLNPLAVDLAKLSLWLATAAKGRPLSFLDHHLRTGNALVGTRVAMLGGVAHAQKPKAKKKAQPAAGQLSMLDDPDFARSMGLAVGSMWLIEESAGNTIDQVREQERLYADLRAELTRAHQQLADVATARDFGLAVDSTLWNGLSAYLKRGGFAVPQYATILRAAGEQAAAQRFFHWDLEFPEVFFDRHGQPLGDAAGFDAVIGNPPYVRQEQLAPIKPYLQEAYPETYHGAADLYIYFYQQGMRLLQRGGRLSYIVTNKWLRAGYGEPLRAFFAAESAIEELIDFGHAPIFEDADVFPCIIVVRKPKIAPHPPTPSPTRGEGEGSRYSLEPSPTRGEGEGSRYSLEPSPTRGEGEGGRYSLEPSPTRGEGEGGRYSLEPSPTRGGGERIAMVERWEIAEPLRAKMIEVARQFRKQPTPSEAILWRALRGQQFDGRKFRRQQPIGPFVVDFFCPSERLIVEVDGPIHNEQRVADRQRQELIEALGLRFVRVTAADVETNLDAVLATIRSAMRPPLLGAGADNEHSHPPLPGAGAGAGADNEHSHPPLPGAGAGAGADNKHSHPPLPGAGAGAGADNKHSHPPLPSAGAGAGADNERSHPPLPGAGAGAGADNEHSHPPLPSVGAGAGADNKHSHPPLPSVGAGAGADNKHSHPPLPSVGEGGRGGEGNLVRVTAFPRAALKLVQLGSYVEKYSHLVPQARLGRAAWSLEVSDVDDLMEKIKRAGVPLAEFAGVKPYYGIKTGLNEAFLIDTPTKDRLVREDPRSAEIIKPYLRGQDIKRWSPEWEGLWLIALKSSSDYAWPWATAGDQAEALFQQHYVAIHRFFKPLEAKLRMRQDKGRYWWELRACAYYDAFDRPKLMYQEIQFHPSYSFDRTGFYSNNKVFFLGAADCYLLAVLNSPLMWWHNWRFLPHMKDEALNPAGFLIEQLPIAPPTDAQRAEVEPAVERLIAITQANQAARRDTLDWLRTEFGVEAAGQKLEAFATLDEAAFVEEVRKRRPKSAGKLSPAGLRALREGYAEQAAPVQQRQAEALKLERRLAELVNQAYGLTPEEIDLLWRTAPPRMPVGRS